MNGKDFFKLVIIVLGTSCTAYGFNSSELLKSLFRNYDSRFRPNFGGPPVKVGITMYILDIRYLNENDMELSFDMYFRQYWNDKRLSFVPPLDQSDFVLPLNEVAKIWKPDTFFPNSRGSSLHVDTVPNYFVRINKEGDVLNSFRHTVTIACPVNLALFPVDTQICPFEIESYGYTMSDVYYTFHRGSGSVGFYHEIIIPGYEFKGFRTQEKLIALSTGNYSRLLLEMVFKRHSSPYVVTVYFPTFLVVILSWLSFWLGSSNKTARIILGLTSILILVELLIYSNDDLPRLEYVTLLDVYMIASIIMVALTLVEFSIVYYFHGNPNDSNTELNKTSKFFYLTDKLDNYSRIAFPILYFSFNIIYWIYVGVSTNVDISGLIE